MVALACPLLLASACGEPPGTALGTYRITMTLEENTCGASAIHQLDGHRYTVQLRSDEKRGYWRIPSQPPLAGSYDAPRFSFEHAGIVANEGPDAGPGGCSLRQTDRLTGELTSLPDAGREDRDGGEDDDDAASEALDAGSAEDTHDAEHDAETDDGSALRGEHLFTISPVRGNDCRAALVPEGAFERLPCTVRYSIRGVPTKQF